MITVYEPHVSNLMALHDSHLLLGEQVSLFGGDEERVRFACDETLESSYDERGMPCLHSHIRHTQFSIAPYRCLISVSSPGKE